MNEGDLGAVQRKAQVRNRGGCVVGWDCKRWRAANRVRCVSAKVAHNIPSGLKIVVAQQSAMDY